MHGQDDSVESKRTVTLANDVEMPLVGLGTWRIKGSQARDAVLWALESGYRHLDTATMYANEAEIGEAIRRSGVAREDLFITTKLPPNEAGNEEQTLQRSLEALGTDYLDLWLVHWPPNGAGVQTWRAFGKAREQGHARAIGVSNYSPEQVDALISETGETPAVNQVKWSPPLFDRARLDHSRRRGVVLEGYSPFRSGSLDQQVLVDIAERYGKNPAQVVVRWHLDHGIVVIPKSERRERIASNFDVFDFSLDSEEVGAIDALSARA